MFGQQTIWAMNNSQPTDSLICDGCDYPMVAFYEVPWGDSWAKICDDCKKQQED